MGLLGWITTLKLKLAKFKIRSAQVLHRKAVDRYDEAALSFTGVKNAAQGKIDTLAVVVYSADVDGKAALAAADRLITINS